jgi:hypothetical protein
VEPLQHNCPVLKPKIIACDVLCLQVIAALF